MLDRLSDEQLVELVQEKPAEELTLEETEQLRDRLRQSPRLQHVLLAQLQMETYLNEALGQVQLSVDQILEQAAAQKQRRHGWPLAIGFTGLLVVALVAVLWFHGGRLRQVFELAQNVIVPEPALNEPLSDKPLSDEPPDENQAPAVEPVPNEPLESLQAEPPISSADESAQPKAPSVISPGASPPDAEASSDSAPSAEPAEPTPHPEPVRPKPAPAWETVAYQVPESLDRVGFPADELKRYLEPVTGKSYAIHEEARQNRHYARLEGLAKLSHTWPEQGVLRLGIFDPNHLLIHFWTGGEGISLRLGPQQRPRMWYAYQATRQGDAPQPERLALLTTDNAAHDRSQLGLFEIRYQHGELLMSRGAVRLLSVPLAAPPTEVYFEGDCRFSHLSLQESGPLPPPVVEARPHNLLAASPARLAWYTLKEQESEAPETLVQPAQEAADDWSVSLAETVTLRGDAEGSVQLMAGSTSAETFAYLRLPSGPGVFEVICCIEDAQPGAGFYLGSAAGRPLHRLGFFRERRTGWTAFGFARPQETHHEIDHDPQLHTAPYAGKQQWLRLVVGYRTLKLWVSGDGQHWGRVGHQPRRHQGGSWTTIGLYALGGEAERQIRLRHLEVRPLQRLRSLAAADLDEQIGLPDQLASMSEEDWLYWTIATRPSEVELAAWQRACALRTMAENRSAALSHSLLWNLLHEASAGPAAFEEQLKLLEEVALWGDHWESSDGQALLQLYQQQFEQLPVENRANHLETLAAALVTSPLWTAFKFEPVPEHIAYEELIRHTLHGDWQAVEQCVQTIRFWQQSAHPDQRARFDKQNERSLLAWAEMLLAQNQPARAAHHPRLPDGWRHPLLTQLSRETYNIMAEFASALAGEAWKEACQIITATGSPSGMGLLPDVRDDQLLVSLPRAVGLAMREHPPLQETMEQQFGRMGLLRVRQAINRADREAIEAATVHFYGTQAAAEAHRWLGDRQLASGQFIEALEQYRLARTTADAQLAEQLAIGHRLASAMLGETSGEASGEALQHAVAMNGIRLEPQPFEALLAELIVARGGEDRTSHDEPALAAEPIQTFALQPYTAQTLTALKGDVGQGARAVDWSTRQMAWAADSQRFYLSNRFTVWGLDRATGDVKWTQRLGDNQGEARRWSTQPMRPLLADGRIYVRRLTKQGPELACLQANDGAVQWRTPAELQVVADPVLAHGRLIALLMTQPEVGLLQISMASFHAETGEVISREPLVRLHDRWDGQPPCQLSLTANRLLCTVGGSTICSDLSGQPQWLRREAWLPREINTPWRTRYAMPPLVEDGRVYTAQAETYSLSCLDLETGREHWMQSAPRLQRLLAIAEGRLLVQTAAGVAAYDAHSGERLWQQQIEDLLDAHLVGTEHLLVSCRIPLEKKTCPALVWLDVQSGQPLAQFALHELEQQRVELGPIIPSAAGDWWMLWDQGGNNAHQMLVRLTPTEGPTPAVWNLPELALWTSHLEPQTHATTAAVMPGWTAITTQRFQGRNSAELRDEFHGEKQVAQTLATKTKPHRFVRKLTVPPGGAKLRMRVGHDSSHPWRLEVAVDGEVLSETKISPETAPNHWRTHEVDLSSLAGTTVWLSVSQMTVEKHDQSHAYWKRLEIILP